MNGAFPTTLRADPGDPNQPAYDRFFARVSDGTNASPYIQVRVLSFNRDTIATSDGIPDNWMIYYFGNANPGTGLNHHAADDADGDGINNLNEYRAGLNGP